MEQEGRREGALLFGVARLICSRPTPAECYGPGRGASRLELGPFSSGFVPSGWFRELNTE